MFFHRIQIYWLIQKKTSILKKEVFFYILLHDNPYLLIASIEFSNKALTYGGL